MVAFVPYLEGPLPGLQRGKRFGQTAAAGRIAKESLPALATNEGLQTYIRAGLADAYRLPSGCSFSARVVGVKLPVKV